MADNLELVTGKTGSPHVDASDVGAFHMGLMGTGLKVLPNLSDGGTPKLTMKDSNTAQIPLMNFVVDGRVIRQKSATTLTIKSGSAGLKRNTIIALHYTRNSSQVESVEWVAVDGSGTSGTPADPSMPSSGRIRDDASDVYQPMWRIPLNGITVGTPVALFSVLGSMSSVWDSLTSAKPVIASNYFPQTMTIEGVRVGSSAMLHVQGGGVNTNAEQDTAIAMLEEAAKPKVQVVTLFGMNGNAWGLLSVNPNGAVNVMHRYVSGNIVWSNIDISVAWVTA
ncbi:hypothetical protein EMO89_02775 [Bifidobacterium tissieri]|uniref:Uncharacterized protein n=1 Tax=Bifidobacterium tissieri TaxID=1630162 RepID=A0A5M9ZVM0_9BIFI|nr:hypothetical protein [Bifidobacterium tissieri]KAA8831664.1 hypothetical protein EMO89_02775 [Bifidobacterium tissieri]